MGNASQVASAASNTSQGVPSPAPSTTLSSGIGNDLVRILGGSSASAPAIPADTEQSDSTAAAGGAQEEALQARQEVERLKKRCAQLESSLQSQSLAQRRLQTELATFQVMARDELRHVLHSRAGSNPAAAHHLDPSLSSHH